MRLPDAQLVPTVVMRLEEQASLDVISQMFHRAADGSSTIAQIGEVCGLDQQLAQRIAAMLASKGLLSIPGWSADKETSSRSSVPPVSTSAQPPDPALLELIGHYKSLLATGTHYELLGVDSDATRSDIRARYFELSKQLHPDRAFGQDLGDIRRQMEFLFQRLTEAYETLSHPVRRGEYDAKHGIVPRPSRTPAPRDSAAPGYRNSRTSVVPGGDETPRATTPPVASSSVPPRRSSSLVRASEGPRPSSAPRHSIAETDDLHRRWQRERTGRALAAALGRPSLTPRPSKSPASGFEEAKLAIDRERYEDAIRFLMPLVAAMPDDPECLGLLDTAKKGLARVRARNLLSRGLVERRRGNFDTAEELFSRAISVDSSCLDAKHLIAEMWVERQVNLGRALTLIKEVIAAGGQKARYYSTMGDILVLGQDISRAKEAFRRALALDPENKELQKKLEQYER